MSSARIVIDPGHCNTDPGALGFREDYNEYEVNLAISKYLKAELESMGRLCLHEQYHQRQGGTADKT